MFLYSTGNGLLASGRSLITICQKRDSYSIYVREEMKLLSVANRNNTDKANKFKE